MEDEGHTPEPEASRLTATPGRAVHSALRTPHSAFDPSREALLAFLVGAEACTVFLAIAAVFGTRENPRGPIPLLVVFALLLLGATVQRVLEAARLFSPEYEIAAGATLVLTLFVAVRLLAFPALAPSDFGWLREAARGFALRPTTATGPVWVVALLVAYAWWRGRSRAEPSIETAYTTLRVGTLASVLSLLTSVGFAPLRDGATASRVPYAATVGFFACALGAIALARLRVEEERGTIQLTPRLLATFLAPVAGLILAGATLSGLFTRRLLETILWLLSPLFFLARLLLLIVVYAATFLAFIVVSIIAWIIAQLAPEGATLPVPPIARATPTPRDSTPFQPVDAPDPLRYLLAMAILIGLSWFLTRFLWRRRRRPPSASGEVRESVFSWGALGAGLAGLLRGAGARIGRRDDPLAGLRDDPRWRHTIVVRETYARLLRRGAATGTPRPPGQTPDEYAPVLITREDFATVQDTVTDLTDRYDSARYGAAPATVEDAAAARAAWTALRGAGRGRKGEGRRARGEGRGAKGER